MVLFNPKNNLTLGIVFYMKTLYTMTVDRFDIPSKNIYHIFIGSPNITKSVPERSRLA